MLIRTMIFSIFIFLWSAYCSAHVNWFSETNDSLIQSSNVSGYSLDEEIVQIVSFFSGVLLIAAFIIDYLMNKIFQPYELRLGVRQHLAIVRIIQVMVGCSLVVSALEGTLFAPHFKIASEGPSVLLGLEFVVGVLLIAGSYVRIGGWLMALMCSCIAVLYGFIALLEYFNYLGLALFFILLGNCSIAKSVASERASIVGVNAIRISLGVGLLTLGFTEKLLNIEQAQMFLKRYSEINFMPVLGFDFSNRLFILCCGACEAVFGIIYLIGWVPRINTLALIFFLVASNTYFFYAGHYTLAMMELTGHAPLFAAALAILVWSGNNLVTARPDRLTGLLSDN